MKTRRQMIEKIIFEADTPAGRWFDIVLIAAIGLSVALVIVESVASVRQTMGHELYILEWALTVIFTLEYVLRIYSVQRRRDYVTSFFGVIDLLAILPAYASLLWPGAQSLLIIRVFRLLRVFRIFKLAHYLGEGQMLLTALRASRPKITVFLMVVLSTVLTMGALMYVVEGPSAGFTSIPVGIYWAIVTMTTVGFGDITPQSPVGQFLASILMVIGYGVIAVPTGIVTTELARASRDPRFKVKICSSCRSSTHLEDALYCRICGALLP